MDKKHTKKHKIILSIIIITLLLLSTYILHLLGERAQIESNLDFFIKMEDSDRGAIAIANVIDSLMANDGPVTTTIFPIFWVYEPEFSITIRDGGLVIIEYLEYPSEYIPGLAQLHGLAQFGIDVTLIEGSEVSCLVEQGSTLVATKETIKTDQEYTSTISIEVCGEQMVFEDTFTEELWNAKVSRSYGVEIN